MCLPQSRVSFADKPDDSFTTDPAVAFTEMSMRALCVFAGVVLLCCAPARAEESAGERPSRTLELKLPANVDECLRTLETVLEYAVEADLLDDQIEEAETHLEKLETACHDGRFDEALAEAKAVEKIVATNK